MTTPIRFIKTSKQIRHANDTDRMVAVMLRSGFSISREDAFDLWEYHSELLNQSWCDLPRFDNAVYAVIMSRIHPERQRQ